MRFSCEKKLNLIGGLGIKNSIMGCICAFIMAATACKIPSSNATILDKTIYNNDKRLVRDLLQKIKTNPIRCDGLWLMNIYGMKKLPNIHRCSKFGKDKESDKCILYRKMPNDNDLHTTTCKVWQTLRNQTDNAIIEFLLDVNKICMSWQ